MGIVVASILDADQLRLGDEIRAVDAAGVDAFSFDVMDGHLVPRITLGPQFVAQLRLLTDLPVEVHLMIEHPEKHIEIYCDAGADLVTFHIEATSKAESIIDYIHSRGLLAGVAIQTDTDIDSIPDEVLSKVDNINVMAVPIGWGGNPPVSTTPDRVVRVRQMLTELNSAAMIEVDGGVKPDNCQTFAARGADLLIIGTGIYKSGDYETAITEAHRNLASTRQVSLERCAAFLSCPSKNQIDDEARRRRLNDLRASLDIPTKVWDPLNSPR